MVSVDDIPEREEKAKEKTRKTINLLKKYFPNSSMGPIGNIIAVSENEEPYNSILMFKLRKSLRKVNITLHFKNYFDNTENFANEYEEFFKGEKIHIETDYSKPL